MTISRTPPFRSATLSLAFAMGFLLATGQVSLAANSWAPLASERLLKLPGDSLERAIENDYAKSGLAQELIGVEEEIAFKQMTLGDLQQAIERADDGEMRVDLQYSFLEAKRDYLKLMQEHQALRKKRAEIKVRLYEGLMERLSREQRAKTPRQVAFIDRQKQARERMEKSTATVDATLLAATAVETSRYSMEYRKNLSAIQELMAAIQNHPMNEAPSIDGRPVSREEYLRQLLAESQGYLAIVEQESLVLGHMAKLVSLDALALAEGIADVEAETRLSTAPSPARQPSEIVSIFTTR